MSVNVRIRNGMEPDAYGDGGVTEGDLRGGLVDLIVGEGVVDVTSDRLLVVAKGTPDMNVIVGKGVGYIPNSSFDQDDSDSIKYWEAVVAGTDGSRTVAIGSNSSGQTRIDLVCLKIDPGATPDIYASNIAELIVVAGTPGAGAPTLPSFHLLLARVSVANGATSITNSNITDYRTQIRLKPEVSISNEQSVSYSPSAGGTVTLDLSKSNDHVINLPAGNITIAVSNPRVGQKVLITIKQHSTGNRLVTWFAGINWEDSIEPILTVTGSKSDLFVIKVRGTNDYIGLIAGLNIS